MDQWFEFSTENVHPPLKGSAAVAFDFQKMPTDRKALSRIT